MNLKDSAEPKNFTNTRSYRCPYLGVRSDVRTLSNRTDLLNYCHKALPIAPVALAYQASTCQLSNYNECPIFARSSRRSLPPQIIDQEWVNLTKATYLRQSLIILAIAGISIVGLILFSVIFQRFSRNVPSANLTDAQQAAVTPSSFSSTPTTTNQPTATLRPTLTRTATLDFGKTQTQQANQQTQNAIAGAARRTASAATKSAAQTVTAIAYATGCETDWSNRLLIQVSDPVFTPINTTPPKSVAYGSTLFLIKWGVTNISPDCQWTTVQLQTQQQNGVKILTLMSVDRKLPKIDEEFQMVNRDNLQVSQVESGQTVTIEIQIDGYELWENDGKIDKTYQLLVNGHNLVNGNLVASLDQWVIVLYSTSTPKTMPTSISAPPSQTPTVGLPR